MIYLLCPECKRHLIPYAVNTLLRDIEIYYCANCCGFWTNQGDANFIQPKDLRPLMSFLPKKGNHPTIQYQHCPKDKLTLQIFRAESVPLDISLYYCPKCHGMWFPENMFFKFKKAQNSKINYFKTWKIPLTSVHAVLLPLLIIGFLGGVLLITLSQVRQNQQSYIKAKELISKPSVIQSTQGQVIISFTTQKAVIGKVRYWYRPDITTEIQTSTKLESAHTVVLNNLETGRSYSYQIILTEPEEVKSPIYTFKTNK